MLAENKKAYGEYAQAKADMRAIEPIKENYDFIILDMPPVLGVLSLNALTVANRV